MNAMLIGMQKVTDTSRQRQLFLDCLILKNKVPQSFEMLVFTTLHSITYQNT